MPRLTRRRRPGRDEHGAVSAIVAVLLSSGVLIGMCALVVDVGRLYVEREQLQTAADAASWKIATHCARKPTECTVALQKTNADTYAKANVADHVVQVEYCIRLKGVTTCTAPNPGTTSNWLGKAPCPALPATNAANYVEVRTSTLNPDNTRLVPPSFAGTVFDPGFAGKQISACGRVSWGPPPIRSVFAMGISYCDWYRMTGNNQNYYSGLGAVLADVGVVSLIGLPAPGTASEQAIVRNGGAGVTLGTTLPLTSCNTPGVPSTYPRGYLFFPKDTTSNCMITVKPGDYVQTSILTDGIAGAVCEPRLRTFVQQRTPILVPIYDIVDPGSNSLVGGLIGGLLAPRWRIVGFAPFQVTGWDTFLGTLLGSVSSILTGSVVAGLNTLLCKTLGGCIYGFFTKTVTPTARPEFGPGTDDFGAVVIGRTG